MTGQDEKLSDFGEHIAGAKKETYTFNNQNLSDPETRSLPLSKLWPKKDIDAIEDKNIAAIAHVLREDIGRKPRKPSVLNRWFEQLESSQNIVRELTEVHSAASQNLIEQLMDASLSDKGYHMQLLSQLARSDWNMISAVSVRNKYAIDERTGDGKPVSGMYRLSLKVDNQPVSLTVSADKKRIIETALPEIKEKIDTIKTRAASGIASPADFVIYEMLPHARKTDLEKEKPFFICARTDKNKQPLLRFADLNEAKDYRNNHADELGNLWHVHKEQYNVHKIDMRGGDNEVRNGTDYRNGRDITPEEFMAVFNIRGGQFGNWVNDAERIDMLNNAYDGFMDLATAIDIPPSSIGLNGTLGVAFGARGSGLASAHYEPGQKVINLTKTRGAGSLAHEWWHALDHYMGGETYLSRSNNTGKALSEPMKDLMHVIETSDYYTRSHQADNARSGAEYFSTAQELSARAFEAYVIDKLKDKGIKNEFLANVVASGDWTKNPDVYPYPKEGEIKTIGQKYEHMMTMLARTDRNFTRSDQQTLQNPTQPQQTLPAQDVTSAVQQSDEAKADSSKRKASEKTYLNVSFEERVEAKSAGAKWDNDAKSWYAPKGTNLTLLQKWLPNEATAKKTAIDMQQGAADTQKPQAPDIDFWKIFYAEISEKERFANLLNKNRTYLAVPFEERKEAKIAGAKWDNDNKSWYAPVSDSVTLETLRKWLPQQQNTVTNGDKIDDFCHAAQAIGLDMSYFSDESGKWHRIPVDGKGSRNKDGAYKLFDNPDGTIGAIARNLSTGEEVKWSNRNPDQEKVASEVVRANELNRAISNQTMHKVREQIATQRSGDALLLFNNLPAATGQEPYLVNKGMQAHGGMKRLEDGSIVVPLISGERVGGMANARTEITSLQVIAPDGDKRIMRQGAKSGSYYPIGTDAARKNPSHVFIAEGVATAESVAQIMRPIYGDKILVVAAIDSGNLQHIADKMQLMYPKVGKTIAADNDIATEQKTGINPGIKAATAVKDKYPDIDIVTPIPSRDKNTDWNDALQRDGIKQCIADVITRNDTRTDRRKAADAIHIQTERKSPREIGHLAFDAIGGNINRVHEVKQALNNLGYQFDERQLQGVKQHPIPLREAFGKAVIQVREQLPTQKTQQTHER